MLLVHEVWNEILTIWTKILKRVLLLFLGGGGFYLWFMGFGRFILVFTSVVVLSVKIKGSSSFDSDLNRLLFKWN
jgi:hypothetical protein